MSGPFGVVSSGFALMRLQDIKAALQAAYVGIYGNPNLADDSVIGQKIANESNMLAQAWEGLQLAYNGAFPALTDEGGIDNVMNLAGLIRKPATATELLCDCVFSGATTISAGKLISNSAGSIFAAIADIVAAGAGVQTGRFACISTGPTSTPANDTLTINTPVSNWQYVGLRTVISCDCVFSGPATISSGDWIVDENGNSFYALADIVTAGAGTVSGVFAWWPQSNVTPTLPIGALAIETVVSGWTSVTYTGRYGDLPVTLGSNLETLAEARVRRANSLMIAGSATLGSIMAAVQNNISTVKLCLAIDNATNPVTVTQPGYINVIVQSKDVDPIGVPDPVERQAIADQIWAKRAGGILMQGAISQTVKDSTGKIQAVNFDYVTSTAVAVTINYSISAAKGDSTPPPNDIPGAITAAIEAAFSAQTIGEDVFWGRMVGAAASVPGITINLLQLNSGSGWVSTDIAIDSFSIGVPGAITPTLM